MTSVLDQMLAAAAQAAGANWNSVRGNAETFAKNLIQDSEQLAKDFAAGKIDSDDVKTDLKMLGDYTDIVENYLEDAVKAAAAIRRTKSGRSLINHAAASSGTHAKR